MFSQDTNGETYHTYGYTNAGWSDLLTSFDGGTITYDAIGNPLTYHDGKTFTWTAGRKLSTVTDGDSNYTYAYDGDGNRISKTVDGQTTDYYYIDGKLLGLKKGQDTLLFLYDETGTAYGFLHNGTLYYYDINLQGDVVGIYNGSGNLVASYTYDVWGAPELTSDNALAALNPLRYRGYFYDEETGFYYLQSRYYNPEVGRFISSDGYVSTGQGILGYNPFAYCGNNPVNRSDPSGLFWKEIGNFFSKAWNGIKTWAKNTFGAGSSTTSTVTIAEKTEKPILPAVTVKTGTKDTKTVSKRGDTTKPISVYANKSVEQPIKSSSAGIKINVSDFTLDLSFGLDNIGLSGTRSNGDVSNSFGLRANLSEFKVGFESSTAIHWDDRTGTNYTNVSVDGWTIIAVGIFVTTGQYVRTPSFSY